MNETILRKTQILTLAGAAVVAVILGFAVSTSFAAGFFLAALWAVAGFWILERLLKAAFVPPGRTRNGFAVVAWVAAKLAIYAIAVWALWSRTFPALSYALGLTMLLVVLVAVGTTSPPRIPDQSTRRGDDGKREQAS